MSPKDYFHIKKRKLYNKLQALPLRKARVRDK